jgi:hypothetical protein
MMPAKGTHPFCSRTVGVLLCPHPPEPLPPRSTFLCMSLHGVSCSHCDRRITNSVHLCAVVLSMTTYIHYGRQDDILNVYGLPGLEYPGLFKLALHFGEDTTADTRFATNCCKLVCSLPASLLSERRVTHRAPGHISTPPPL